MFDKANKEITSFVSNDKVSKGRKFYMKLVGSMVNVHLRQFMTLADQPERKDLTAITAGNGIFTGRWGYSANLHALWKVLVPCKSCREKLFADRTVKPFLRTWDSAPCDACTRWEVDTESPLLDLPLDDAKYPKEAFPGGVIRPFRYVSYVQTPCV